MNSDNDDSDILAVWEETNASASSTHPGVNVSNAVDDASAPSAPTRTALQNSKRVHNKTTKPYASPAKAKRNNSREHGNVKTFKNAACTYMKDKYIQAEWNVPMFQTLLRTDYKWTDHSVNCYLACKAALLASGEGLRKTCFLGYGPFSFKQFPAVDRPQEREIDKENQVCERKNVQDHVAAIDAATEVLLLLHAGRYDDGHYFLLQHCKKDDYVTLYQVSKVPLNK